MFKHNVKYHQCSSCGLIQTENPHWINEAYKKAITFMDIGLLARNINLSRILSDLLENNFDSSKRFLDYGGGYGILVRLLRDKGLDFFRQDKYCENLFAVNHDISDLENDELSFELVTCFEVFEHTNEPYKLFEELKKYSSNILISTLLVPEREIKSVNDWWYFAPEIGQHITFYTHNALVILASHFNMNLYSNGQNLHLFTDKKLNQNPLDLKFSIIRKIKNKVISYLTPIQKTENSLLESDLNIARQKALENAL